MCPRGARIKSVQDACFRQHAFRQTKPREGMTFTKCQSILDQLSKLLNIVVYWLFVFFYLG